MRNDNCYRVTNVDGRVCNPFFLASCNKESGPSNLHIATVVDNIVLNLEVVSEFRWETLREEDYDSMMEDGMSKDEAQSNLKPWYAYYGMEDPAGHLADFAWMADWLEKFLRSPQSEELLFSRPDVLGNEMRYAMNLLVVNLRELDRFAANERGVWTDFSPHEAMKNLRETQRIYGFDPIFMAYRRFQGDLLSYNVDWHMLTCCFRSAVESEVCRC